MWQQLGSSALLPRHYRCLELKISQVFMVSDTMQHTGYIIKCDNKIGFFFWVARNRRPGCAGYISIVLSAKQELFLNIQMIGLYSHVVNLLIHNAHLNPAVRVLDSSTS